MTNLGLPPGSMSESRLILANQSQISVNRAVPKRKPLTRAARGIALIWFSRNLSGGFLLQCATSGNHTNNS